MNSHAIRLNVRNPRSLSVYAEIKVTSRQILKRFGPDLINSDQWFYILKFVAQKSLLKGPQIKFCKEALFVKYYKNQNVRLLQDPIPIKYLPYGKKVLRSFIAPSIKQVDCSDEWKFTTHHCVNGSSHIQGIDIDQSYIPLSNSYSFIINIAISYMHRLTTNILDVSNTFHITHLPLMKQFVSVHHPIIWNGLKNITPMLLSIVMTVHFVSNV